MLDALVGGGTNAEIAVRLGLSAETVKSHIGRMLAETDSTDRAALVRWWQGRAVRRPMLLPWFGRAGKVSATVVAASLGVLLLVAGTVAVRRVVLSLPSRPGSVGLELTPAATSPSGAAALPTAAPTAAPTAPPAAYMPPPTQAATPTATIVVGDEPYYPAVGEGAVWVPNRRDGTLMRVDPETNAVVATIPIGDPGRGSRFGSAPSPGVAASAAVGGGFVWVTKEDEKAVAQVDPRTNRVVAVISLGLYPHQVAAGQESLWVTSREGSQEDAVLRVDYATGRLAATIRTPVPGSLAVTNDAVWVTNVRGDSVTRIDPRTNTIAAVIALGGPGPHPICSLCTNVVVAAGGAVWATITPGGVGSLLARIDPATNQVVAHVSIQSNPIKGHTDGRSIWISHFESGTVTRVDPLSNTVTAANEVGYQLFGSVLDADTLWATSHMVDTLVRIKLLP